VIPDVVTDEYIICKIINLLRNGVCRIEDRDIGAKHESN